MNATVVVVVLLVEVLVEVLCVVLVEALVEVLWDVLVDDDVLVLCDVLVDDDVLVVGVGDVVLVLVLCDVLVVDDVLVVGVGDVVLVLVLCDVLVVDDVLVVGVGDVVLVLVLCDVLVVAFGAVVEVVPATVVVVVPPPAHASQQLELDPTEADPPAGARQAAAFFLMLQLFFPFEAVRQQVTKPGLPQVERAAQCVISPWHSERRAPLWTASLTTCATQLTYFACELAVAQSHVAAAWARTSAT